MDIAEQDHLWELLAKAIFASGTPFSIVENVYWRNFFNALNPAFILPTRKILSTKLLDAEYDRVLKLVNKKIEDCTIYSVQIDGWSNIRREPIVNTVVSVPQPLLYKTTYTETVHHTAEYFAKELKETIMTCGKERCLSVCADNASTMVKALRFIKEDPDLKGLPISCFGCIDHSLNLLAIDILKQPNFAKIKGNVVNVITIIRSSYVINEHFKVIQKEKYARVIALKLPIKTRWCYDVDCMQSFLKNKRALQDVANDLQISKYVTQNIKQLLLNELFWVEVEQLCSIMEPIKIWIAKFESDTSCINKVPAAIAEICSHLRENVSFAPISKTEEENIMKSVEKRTSSWMVPLHYAAHILDPQFKGSHLSEQQFQLGCDYILKVAKLFNVNESDVKQELSYYMNRLKFWKKKFVWSVALITKNDPRIWWNTVCALNLLSKTATSILSVPPTSAATERTFSTYSNIHTKKRNKLKAERAGKIVMITKNLKTFSNEDKEEDEIENQEAYENESSFIDDQEFSVEMEELLEYEEMMDAS